MKKFLSLLLAVTVSSITCFATSDLNVINTVVNDEVIEETVSDVQKDIPLFIFDTDFCSDIDDAFALSMLLGYERQGLIDLIGISHVSSRLRSVEASGALCLQSKVYDMPIATPKEDGIDLHSSYINEMAAWGNGHSETMYWDTVTFYNQMFYENFDRKINIVCTGQLTQLDRVLKVLGADLFAQHVDKIYWVGTKYNGKDENNTWFGGDTMKDKVVPISQHFIANCPVPIVYIPADSGGYMSVGRFLNWNDKKCIDILTQAKQRFDGGVYAVTAFDPFGVLVAVADANDLNEQYGLTYETGVAHITGGGGSWWEDNPLSKDRRVRISNTIDWYNYQMDLVLGQEFTVRTGLEVKY